MGSDSALPTSIDSLVLPQASHNFSQTLSSLKRSRLSIRNRLSSIVEDASFVQTVAERYDLPLIANERCGSWYIPLNRKAGSVYFKSTDGHQGQWMFSTRRLNLQLFEIVEKHNGLERVLLRLVIADHVLLQMYYCRFDPTWKDNARCFI